MKIFPDEALAEDGTLVEGWVLSDDGTLKDPEGTVHELKDGKYTKREPVRHVKDEDIASIIIRANNVIQSLEESDIVGRLAAAEKQLEEAQRFWERPENRQVDTKEPEIDIKDANSLFIEKGIEGLTEAVRRKSSDERIVQLQTMWDDLWLVDSLLRGFHGAMNRPYDHRQLKTYSKFKNYLQKGCGFDLDDLITKADSDGMSTTLSSAGGNWVPTGWSNQMIEFFRVSRHVPNLFDVEPMPNNPWRPPLQTGRVSIYNASEATSASATAIRASTMGTSYVEYDAEKPAGRVVWTGELDEDSVIAMLPRLREELPRAIAEAIEDAMINGQDTGTHLDSDIAALGDDDHRKMWDGFRYHANQNSGEYDVTTGSTSYAYDDHAQGRMLQGKYAALEDPANGYAWVLSYKAYLLATSFTELKSADYVGLSNVTGLTGVVNMIGGSPVFVSEFVRQNLNASGVYDGSTTSYTEAIGVTRRAWKIGDRRQETIEVVRIPRTDQFEIIIMKRCDFQAQYVPGSGESLACVLYAIS